MRLLEFKFHPRVRKVDPETEKEIASHVQLNASRKLVQQNFREKTGKTILMKDLHNIATLAKQTSQESIATSSSEVQELSNWLSNSETDFTKNRSHIMYVQCVFYLVDGRFGHGRFGLGRFGLGRFGHGRFGQAIFKGGRFGQIYIFRRFI